MGNTARQNTTLQLNDVETSRTLPIKGMTREQIVEKRKEELCFSCNEPYSGSSM